MSIGLRSASPVPCPGDGYRIHHRLRASGCQAGHLDRDLAGRRSPGGARPPALRGAPRLPGGAHRKPRARLAGAPHHRLPRPDRRRRRSPDGGDPRPPARARQRQVALPLAARRRLAAEAALPGGPDRRRARARGTEPRDQRADAARRRRREHHDQARPRPRRRCVDERRQGGAARVRALAPARKPGALGGHQSRALQLSRGVSLLLPGRRRTAAKDRRPQGLRSAFGAHPGQGAREEGHRGRRVPHRERAELRGPRLRHRRRAPRTDPSAVHGRARPVPGAVRAADREGARPAAPVGARPTHPGDGAGGRRDPR